MGVKSLDGERCRQKNKKATQKQGYQHVCIVKAFSADTSHETLQLLPSNPHCIVDRRGGDSHVQFKSEERCSMTALGHDIWLGSSLECFDPVELQRCQPDGSRT
jgi:hypothetical protein